MNFGEKLFKLRKENSLSQEALAEKLNTTRQAISKWENGQGYPETEKLLLMGNIFEVSIDYLLKDTVQDNKESDEGYYVSKEMAEGYLLNRSKLGKYLGTGLFVIALAFIPYFFFNQEPKMYALPTIIIAAIGIGITGLTHSLEENQYKVLKQEPLLLDETYLKELQVRYEALRKKYKVFMLVGLCVFMAGFLPMVFEKKGVSSGFFIQYYPICITLIAIGIYILTRTSTVLEGYKLLAQNEEYTNRFHFKIMRRLRRIMDKI